MRRKFHYPPGAFRPLREQLVDQTLAQCRCGVVLTRPAQDVLAQLLQHPCLVVLPVTPPEGLRWAGTIRRLLPQATILPGHFLAGGCVYSLLVDPDTFVRGDGVRTTGMTDGEGMIPLQQGMNLEGAAVRLLKKKTR